MQTKKKVESYSKARKQKSGLLSNALYRGVKDVRKLEKHVGEFIIALDKDKNLSDKELFKQIQLFEQELHEEAQELRKEIKHGLNHLHKGYQRLVELKEKQEKHTSRAHPLKNVLVHELKLAETLVRDMNSKLESLEKIFKRIE